MELSLENTMLHAIQAKNLNLVSKLLSKGANPNKTVSNGKTCLGEAAVMGFTDIAKLLIAESHSDKQVSSDDDDEEDEYDFALKNRENEASVTPLKKKLVMLSTNTKYTTERAGKQTLCKSCHKSGHGFGSSRKDSKVQSPQSDLEWDEDIGKVAANTKEDDIVTNMYQWYASILETTGEAVMAASDFTYGLEQEDAYGKTALSYACAYNNIEIFKALVEAGCKIDAPEAVTGLTVLHSACKKNRLELVKVLLAAGCDVNIRTMTNTNTPALHIAAAKSLEMTTILVDHGANLELRDPLDRTALSVAAAEGYCDIVKFLISRGACFNIEDWEGHTPLCSAVKNNNVDVAGILLESGVRVAHFQCMLHFAVKCEYYYMVRLLADRGGCGINVHNSFGDTPLMLAIATEYPVEFIKLLINKGANVNACNTYSGANVLHLATELILVPDEFEAVLNTLIDGSININEYANTRGTALNRAIRLRRDQSAMQLIRHGADVNLKDSQTHVPDNLTIASKRKNNQLANMLIKAGHTNVSLDFLLYPTETVSWIKLMFRTPLSLADICRIRIRNMRNGKTLIAFVRTLPIPEMIKNFLMMEELVR